MRIAAAVLGATGVVALAALLVDGWAGEITWVTGFQHVHDPLYTVLRPLLPDYRVQTTGTWARHGICIAVMAALALAGWHSARRSTSNGSDQTEAADTDPTRSMTAPAVR